MRIVRFLLLFVGLASHKSPHPGGPRLDEQLFDDMGDLIKGSIVKKNLAEKWRQRLQALLYNYRHSAIESRGEKQVISYFDPEFRLKQFHIS